MSKLRVEKIQELIKQEISMMLMRGEIRDPRVKNVTVTAVEASNDLSYAKIFVSFYGPEAEQEAAWKGLNNALGYLRTQIAKRISLRVAPQLSFVKDTSLAYSDHIQKILNKIATEDSHHE